MYTFYLHAMRLPVAPGRVAVVYGGRAAVLTLTNGNSAVLRGGGLGAKSYTFDVLLPAARYPFAVYGGEGFKPPSYYIGYLEKWRDCYFTFSVSDGGTPLISDTVTIDRLSYERNARDGRDVTVRLTLITYDPAAVTVTRGSGGGGVVRDAADSRGGGEVVSYTVVRGDCLWSIAKKYLGSGTRYPEIYERNKSLIDAYNIKHNMPQGYIYGGQVLQILRD
ncbi:phage protein [Clostridia bacterium]|nr:phage protein [Clostridia bacterium]